MKTNPKNTAKNAAGNQRSTPENKDNLDSRQGEEQRKKGEDTTHNKKEKHSEHKTKK